MRAIRHPGDAPPERGYVPSPALVEFVRCRDLTCRWPGCDKPADECDLDHTIPYPVGPTHASNLKCYCRFQQRQRAVIYSWICLVLKGRSAKPSRPGIATHKLGLFRRCPDRHQSRSYGCSGPRVGGGVSGHGFGSQNSWILISSPPSPQTHPSPSCCRTQSRGSADAVGATGSMAAISANPTAATAIANHGVRRRFMVPPPQQ